MRDGALKRRIRIAAEREEKESYEERMPADWLKALEHLGTDWHKRNAGTRTTRPVARYMAPG